MAHDTDAPESVTLEVVGMTCGSCKRQIEKELRRVAGFHDAQVRVPEGTVRIEYERGSATPEELVQAVVRASYPALAAARTTGSGPSGTTRACGCSVAGLS